MLNASFILGVFAIIALLIANEKIKNLLNKNYLKRGRLFLSWSGELAFWRYINSLFNPKKYLQENKFDEGLMLLWLYALIWMTIGIILYYLFN